MVGDGIYDSSSGVVSVAYTLCGKTLALFPPPFMNSGYGVTGLGRSARRILPEAEVAESAERAERAHSYFSSEEV